MAKKSFNSQFRGGYTPAQAVDPDNRVKRDSSENETPAKVRKRAGIAPGFQTKARPGLVGMQDYKRKSKRGR